MKLNLQRRGRKFFFITLVTEGRINVLSKINDDATVTLLEAGEKVAETWRETHKRNAALTASNFIIMPDHCHLLLIVNYDLDPDFDLIDWVHGFMERTAPTRRGVLSPNPSEPASAWGGMPAEGLCNVAAGGGLGNEATGGSGDLPRLIGPGNPSFPVQVNFARWALQVREFLRFVSQQIH